MHMFHRLKMRGKLISTHVLVALVCVGVAYSGLPLYAAAPVGVALAVLIAYFVSRDVVGMLNGLAAGAFVLARGEIKRNNQERKEKTKQRGDEFANFGFAFDQLEHYFDDMARAAERVAAGDLTVEVTPKCPNDELGVAFVKMIHSLREVVSQLAESATELASSSESLQDSSQQTGDSTQQIAVTIQQVARGAGEQTRAVTESAAIVEQMNQAIERVALNAHSVAATSAQATSSAKAGSDTVGRSVEAMARIRESITPAADKIKELGLMSTEIGKIVEVIDDIAEQTNLLALNAAIEAARAGEHGKGFAVVADEVRKLAERSSKATKEIANLVATVQSGTEHAVTAMGAGVTEVEQGSTLALEAGKSLEEILRAIEATNQQIQAISADANEMKQSSTSVVNAIDNISSIAEENAAAAEEVSASTEEASAQVQQMGASVQLLSQMAEELHALVARFKLENQAAPAPIQRRRQDDWHPKATRTSDEPGQIISLAR